MANEKELGDRLARVVERISRGEFKLVSLVATRPNAMEPNLIDVQMRLKRSPKFGEDGELKSVKPSKLRRPPNVTRQLIFDEDE